MTEIIPEHLTAKAIRQTFIDYFEEHSHTFVRSSSLVPGGDSTLLFTNSGMVQFKDVFLGTDKRPYTRAANSQKSMRVAGKHNDLDDVGRDDTHHTFFEMLGNWSFGDYYKEEAILWAWDLLTNVWDLPKSQLYVTCFKDDIGDIPTDDEAADIWRKQPGLEPDHIFYLGREDNFWEMAETGPCGPNSEIHFDLHPEDGPVVVEDLDTDRFLELWNLVFIQYNRTGPNDLEPLKAKHVDTGLGLERIVSVLQKKPSNYRTDMLWPLIERTQELTQQSDEDREAHFTAYRVIADHARAAAFLIADGVIPGNLGRNYITRMIIRRAYRFGAEVGLTDPFLAAVAEVVVNEYGRAYPELENNRSSILNYVTREEEQFQRTLDRATSNLQSLLDELAGGGGAVLSGEKAADLYTTYGMPLEISRDIARERGLDVDEAGFVESMDAHRLASGKGSAMGIMGAQDAELYDTILERLQGQDRVVHDGVSYEPYGELSRRVELLALVHEGLELDQAGPGDQVEFLTASTSFYIEAGGQVSDTGSFTGPDWELEITGMRRPAAGVIVHQARVLSGHPKPGDSGLLAVDGPRRKDIMRNHTATHLLHAALDELLGEHARQAGSLVAPERLRFDFTHPDPVSRDQLEAIEVFVNEHILENHPLVIVEKALQDALDEGVRALFGEKYGEQVRTIRMGDFSYELCGGTHCPETNDIGLFMITSEASAAAGIRRIEAITGRAAYKELLKRRTMLNEAAKILGTTPEAILDSAESMVDTLQQAQKEVSLLRQKMASAEFTRVLEGGDEVNGVNVLTAMLQANADSETLRMMADTWRQRNPKAGVALLASIYNDRPLLVAAVTDDLVARGVKAGDLAGFVARQLGGGGGGKPTMAQAGGKDAEKLPEALDSVKRWVEEKLA
jgi:alanyl-tRNA synthetase